MGKSKMMELSIELPRSHLYSLTNWIAGLAIGDLPSDEVAKSLHTLMVRGREELHDDGLMTALRDGDS